MTKTEALNLLETAPTGQKPSKVNPTLTQMQAVNIVRNGILALKTDVLPDIFEKRVWQVVKNRKMPRY